MDLGQVLVKSESQFPTNTYVNETETKYLIVKIVYGWNLPNFNYTKYIFFNSFSFLLFLSHYKDFRPGYTLVSYHIIIIGRGGYKKRWNVITKIPI